VLFTPYKDLPAAADFVDAQGIDYRLRKGVAAIGRGGDPGSAYGFSLRPNAEYVHPARIRSRRTAGPVDLGALRIPLA
jgi:hypothetical protein